jgi:hypothetical protein
MDTVGPWTGLMRDKLSAGLTSESIARNDPCSKDTKHIRVQQWETVHLEPQLGVSRVLDWSSLVGHMSASTQSYIDIHSRLDYLIRTSLMRT